MQCQRRTDTAFACPVVGRREVEKRQQGHRERIQNIKSAIDTRAPTAQPHLTLYGRDYVAKKKATTEAAFSDLKMIQSIARTMTRRSEIPARMGPVSLNAGQRKQEIFRVMRENHRLLDRLETLEPVINARSALQDHDWKRRYVINSSHSMRMAGEYDDEIDGIHSEDRARTFDMQRSCQMRLSRRNMQSVSLPALPSASPPQAKKKPTSGGQKAARGRPNGGPLATGGIQEAHSSSFSPNQHQAQLSVVVYDDEEHPHMTDQEPDIARHSPKGPSSPLAPAAGMPLSLPTSQVADVERDAAVNESQHSSHSAYENTFEADTQIDRGSTGLMPTSSPASHAADVGQDAAENDTQHLSKTAFEDTGYSGFEPASVGEMMRPLVAENDEAASGASPFDDAETGLRRAQTEPARQLRQGADGDRGPVPGVEPSSPGCLPGAEVAALEESASPSEPAVGVTHASPTKSQADEVEAEEKYDEDFDDASMTASKFMQSNASAGALSAARKEAVSRGSDAFEESFEESKAEKAGEESADSFEDS